MNLPFERNTQLEARIEMLLSHAIHSRQCHGMHLLPVVLDCADRDYLGVSSISDPPCALYYRLNGAEKETTDTGSQFGFDTGHVLESYVLDLLEITDRQGELVWPYKDAPGGVVKGHYDGKALDCIVECKATGAYAFMKRVQEGPAVGHIEQAFIYAAIADVPYFVIVYCNREAKKSTPFYHVTGYAIPDMAAARDYTALLFDTRFKPVLNSRFRPEAPQAPKYEFGKTGWRCRPDKIYYARGKENLQVGYCSYRRICPDARRFAAQEQEKAVA